MSNGSIHAALAKQSCHFAHPPCPIIYRVMPVMLVPSGRPDAGAITAVITQATVGPWDPGAVDLYFGKALQKFIVFLLRGHVGKCRRMPGTTNNGNGGVHFPLCLPDHFTHVRFAELFSSLILFSNVFPQRLH